jgi:hypothetical protein
MAFDYNGILNSVVTPLIEEFGTTVAIQRVTTSGFDAVSGENFQTVNSQFAYVVIDEPTTLLKETTTVNKVVYASPEGLAFDPVVGDRVVIGDDTRTIIKCIRHSPGAVTVLWELHIK